MPLFTNWFEKFTCAVTTRVVVFFSRSIAHLRPTCVRFPRIVFLVSCRNVDELNTHGSVQIWKFCRCIIVFRYIFNIDKIAERLKFPTKGFIHKENLKRGKRPGLRTYFVVESITIIILQTAAKWFIYIFFFNSESFSCIKYFVNITRLSMNKGDKRIFRHSIFPRPFFNPRFIFYPNSTLIVYLFVVSFYSWITYAFATSNSVKRIIFLAWKSNRLAEKLNRVSVQIILFGACIFCKYFFHLELLRRVFFVGSLRKLRCVFFSLVCKKHVFPIVIFSFEMFRKQTISIFFVFLIR